MTLPLVLDAAGLDALTEPRPPEPLRALLAEAWRRDRDVLVPAVVCAEACRGTARTRGVEAALSRKATSARDRPAVEVVVTDFRFARQVGAILHATRSGSEDLADAHVVATCVTYGGGMVVTADPADIARLAEAVPSVRIVTRPPR